MASTETVPPEVAPVRPGEHLDWESLARFLQAHIPGFDGDWRVLQFPNGSANLTFLVEFGLVESGAQRLVVRRPPFGVIAPGAHDMRREYRVLSTLWRHFDQAPRAYVLCDDHSVIGADFIVIEYRAGEVVRGAIPPSMHAHEDVGRRVGFAVVDALAALHRLDPAATGLGDLGRPDGFLERQVGGWRRRWELAAPPHSGPLMPAVGARLEQSMPVSARTAILHNDCKLDNCQFDPADPDRVKSIFDWDMATLGDPLVDVGTLLNYWPDPSDPPGSGPMLNPGMETLGLPARADVVERYAAATGFDVTSVPWYEAFGCWKTAVILQQLNTRYLRGETTDKRMATYGDHVGRQARRAASILDRAGFP